MADLIDLVGKDAGSAEVVALLDTIAPTRIWDDPPFRQYVGSPERGLDLVVEHDRVVAVQIHARPTSMFRSYTGETPFGLNGAMNQDDVHRLVGTPALATEVSSRYVLTETDITLVVSYDEGRRVRMVSLEMPL